MKCIHKDISEYKSALFQLMSWSCQTTSHLVKQCWSNSVVACYITKLSVDYKSLCVKFIWIMYNIIYAIHICLTWGCILFMPTSEGKHSVHQVIKHAIYIINMAMILLRSRSIFALLQWCITYQFYYLLSTHIHSYRYLQSTNICVKHNKT